MNEKKEVFLIADTHFGHQKMVTEFNDGKKMKKMRPWDSVEEMNEAMVKLWNDTVRPNDKIYHLGDFVLNRRFLEIAGRLNGKKILIKGNHDVFRIEEYTKHFVDILSCHVLSDMILTHVPVHPNQLSRFKINVHGHMHDKYVTKEVEGVMVPDERYICVSVERIGFKPIHLNDVRNLNKNID